jgi:Zn-dependent protease
MSEPTIASPSQVYPPVEVFVARPPRRRTWLYVLFFLLTVFTTLVVGARMEYYFRQAMPALSLNEDSIAVFPLPWVIRHPSNLWLGIPFSATLMLILFAHEMGHYLYCRYYGVYATLPFFVPFPSLIGTLGAFIRIKSPIRSRSALFDIGIAGPIAGFVVASIALVIGLIISQAMPAPAPSPDLEIGYPLIFQVAARLLHRPGVPLPYMNLHPVAIAAWVGMFATALNLLPGGQLDGGHIVFSISPQHHAIVSSLTILILIPLGIYYWLGWFVWAVLLRLSGMRHPIVPAWPGITRGRRGMALLGVMMLLLTFTPSPFKHASGREVLGQAAPGIREFLQRHLHAH